MLKKAGAELFAVIHVASVTTYCMLGRGTILQFCRSALASVLSSESHSSFWVLVSCSYRVECFVLAAKAVRLVHGTVNEKTASTYQAEQAAAKSRHLRRHCVRLLVATTRRVPKKDGNQFHVEKLRVTTVHTVVFNSMRFHSRSNRRSLREGSKTTGHGRRFPCFISHCPIVTCLICLTCTKKQYSPKICDYPLSSGVDCDTVRSLFSRC